MPAGLGNFEGHMNLAPPAWSSLGAHHRLRQDATNTTQLGLPSAHSGRMHSPPRRGEKACGGDAAKLLGTLVMPPTTLLGH